METYEQRIRREAEEQRRGNRTLAWIYLIGTIVIVIFVPLGKMMRWW
jgi:CHASE3 domain sensor protein